MAGTPVQVKTKDADAVKLFIGQIPRGHGESDLMPILEEFGPVFELHILRDKLTGTSKGCAFVTYCHRISADKCLQSLHGNRTLPGMNHALQVKLADSEQQKDEQRKLFIGMLAKSANEDQLRAMFAPYGTVEDLTILRTPAGESKGCAFVRYATLSQAQAAVTALHNSITMEGCAQPIVVKPAETEKEKQQKRQQKGIPGMPAQFGALNNMFPNPMMYQQMLQQQQMMQQMGQGYGQMGMGMGMNPVAGMGAIGQDMTQFGMAQQGIPGMQQGFAGAFGYGQQGFGAAAFQAAAQQPAAATGPEGANLFIYHLPLEWGDHDLFQAFSSFGNVVSSKVFIDKNTNQSKCFGFVSYDNANSANNAIQHMNGYQVGNKRLKVQLKRSKEASRPY